MLMMRYFELLDSMPKPGSEGDRFRRYRSKMREGRIGKWSIEKFEVTKNIELMRMARDGRGTPPGMYTKLHCDGVGVVMSDTDAEIWDHMPLFDAATGRVLIHGLGLGMAIQGVLNIPEVTHVDVVEIEQDVIDLVYPQLQDDRLVVHKGDAFKFVWPKNSRWDCVWHDIWNTQCDDNAGQMTTLRNKFKNRCSWQGCWGA